jgi:hypothetical protein
MANGLEPEKKRRKYGISRKIAVDTASRPHYNTPADLRSGS